MASEDKVIDSIPVGMHSGGPFLARPFCCSSIR